MPQPADEVDLVLLELHPGPTAVPACGARAGASPMLRGFDLDMGREIFEQSDKGRVHGLLARSEPTAWGTVFHGPLGVRSDVPRSDIGAGEHTRQRPGER